MMSSGGLSDCKAEPAGPIDLSSRQAGIGLAIILASLFALRGPLIYREPGGEDEQYYAIPGWAMLTTGVPCLPHVPARNPESVFYRGNEALFAEPPLYFVIQAPLFAILPAVHGTARLISLLAAGGLLVVTYFLGREWQCARWALLVSLGMLSLSRWFFFLALRARPDMLCALCGTGVMLCLAVWQRTGRNRELASAGVLLGLGGLIHPFAIVYAMQAAVWSGITGRSWRRLINPALLAAISIAIAATWIPMILAYPEPFTVQFRNQFLHGEGGSILGRLVMPMESLRFHAIALWKYIGPWQLLMPIGSLLVNTAAALMSRRQQLAACVALAVSSLYLICVLIGTHHLVYGYFVYPSVFLFLSLAQSLTRICSWKFASAVAGCRLRQLIAVLLLCSMVPGSGVKTWLVHLRHWGDINYNAPAFASDLIQRLPAAAVYAVDVQFTFDFLAHGRKTYPAELLPQYFRLEQFDFDYLVISRHGLDTRLASRFPGRLVLTAGKKDDPFACYVEVYDCHYRAPAANNAP